jgi:fermentation-respiration switch protein FrsA (DUF1100 family)
MALVLQSPYTSMMDIVRYRYPYVPFLKYCLKDQYNSLNKIGKISSNILIVHGEDDAIVPVWMGQKLYENINTSKLFLRVPGAAHSDVVSPDVMEHIIKFITNF